MNKEKISSQEIIDLVASKASVSKRAAEEFLKVMIASVEEGLLAGEVVKIKNFGTFKLQWNEPRKSVNIQSGEEIIISGYYKVVFIPDNLLKEQINEPFAHLEPVELDIETQKNESDNEPDLTSDPLRLFNEQASEIKNLISEIQALSSNSVISKNEDNTVVENTVDDKDNSESNEYVEELTDHSKENESALIEEEPKKIEHTQEDSNISIENEKEPIKSEHTPEESNIVVENTEEINSIIQKDSETLLQPELPSTPYLDDIEPLKSKKGRKLILLILILVFGIGTGFFLFTRSDSKLSINKISEKFSISEIINTVSLWFSPATKPETITEKIVIPKDTNEYDSIRENQPIDSLQFLFDNPRVYSVFIASERIKNGNRLTIMSKRYYGNKDFWVYIYEANKDKISNPDKIETGTLIRIPKLDARLIDASNPRCIEKARQLHDIYIK